MELTFEKIDGQWVAEFEATSDFNINLDRVGKGALTIYLKGSKDGTYASQASYRNTKDSENIDADITALVYPKYIKVVSQTEVVKGIVTMDGEGGSSGSGVSIRPVTADDVVLMTAPESPTVDAVNVPFSESVDVPAFKVLFVCSNKQLYFGEKQSHVCGNVMNPHPDYEYTYVFGKYAMSNVGWVTLDLYIQD